MRRLLTCFGLVLALASFASDERVAKAQTGKEAITLGAGGSGASTRPLRPSKQPIDADIVVLGKYTAGSNTALRLTVTPQLMCGKELNVTVISKWGLVYDGPETWTATVEKDQEYSTTLTVDISNGDTSSIQLLITCGSCVTILNRYFVVAGDSVELWEFDPRSMQPVSKFAEGNLTRITPSGMQPEELNQGEQPYFRSHIIDSTANENSQIEEMRKFEEEPLKDAQVQYHSVGKDLYRRLEGEKEFTLIERLTAEESRAKRQAYLDSLAGLPPNAEIRVCLNLRGHHLEFVNKMVGPLGKPESESYYHLTVTKAMLEQLKEQGIPIMYLDIEDMVHRPHPSDLPPSSVPSEPQGNNR